VRRPGRPQDRPRRRGERLPLVGPDPGDHDQHAVSDEEGGMPLTTRALSGRTFLRGAGAAVALPLLDAMVPAMTATAQTPAAPQRLRRLGYVYMPMGCDRPRWTPQGGDRK